MGTVGIFYWNCCSIGTVRQFCWGCGSGPFVSPIEDAIAYGATFPFVVYHSYILFIVKGREREDVRYILERKTNKQTQHIF